MAMRGHIFSSDPVVVQDMHILEISEWAEEEVLEQIEEIARTTLPFRITDDAAELEFFV